MSSNAIIRLFALSIVVFAIAVEGVEGERFVGRCGHRIKDRVHARSLF